MNINDLRLYDIGKHYYPSLSDVQINHCISWSNEGMSNNQWPDILTAFRAIASAETHSNRLRMSPYFS